MRYRERTAPVDAYRWTGQPEAEWPAWLLNAKLNGAFTGKRGWPATIRSALKGTVVVEVGNYIVEDAKGDRYPVDSCIFESTYEPVED